MLKPFIHRQSNTFLRPPYFTQFVLCPLLHGLVDASGLFRITDDKDFGLAWTIISDTPSWLRIGIDAQGTAVANSKTGIGNAVFYAYASSSHSNKDVPRKTTLALTHEGIASSTKTIEVIQKYTPVVDGEKSNSYILSPGTAVAIPVVRANESPLAIGSRTEQIQSGTSWTACLVWESEKGLIALSAPSGTGPSGRFTVVAPKAAAQGNAVVAVKNGNNEILWSWHIWVTTYDGSTTFTRNNGKSDIVFMDRALGATSATPGELSSCGLMYQWGRKDPLPGIGQEGGSWSITDRSDPIRVYNSLGHAYEISKAPVPNVASNNLTAVTRNPDTFYHSANPPNDWFVYDNSSAQNHDLWSGGNILLATPAPKSVFDPCPVGWRVPPFVSNTSPFAGMKTGWSWGDNGMNWSGTGGYFPASGGRASPSGGIDNVGTIGCIWSGAPGGTSGLSLHYYVGGVVTINYNSRAHCYPVRCCKD